MKSGITTDNWQMGMATGKCVVASRSRKLYRLLQAPFDFSQAFDQALKNIVIAIPNRPARESSDDVVSMPSSRAVWKY